MSTATNPFKLFLLRLIGTDDKVRITIRDMVMPLGPGKVGRADEGLLLITADGNLQTTPNARPQPVLVPVMFNPDDVTSIELEPTTMDGTPLSQTTAQVPGQGEPKPKIWTPHS